MNPASNEPLAHLEEARAIAASLGLEEQDGIRLRPVSGHNSSLLLPCRGPTGKDFVLKLFVPPADSRFYPAEVRVDDYARREAAFYRFLDSVDPERLEIPAPRTVWIDSKDPPRWVLLEWIHGAVGPTEEVLGQDQIFDLLSRLRSLPLDRLAGRRDFPLNHWDVVSYLLQGGLEHRDSAGNRGRLGPGDVQWKRSADGLGGRRRVVVDTKYAEQSVPLINRPRRTTTTSAGHDTAPTTERLHAHVKHRSGM